MPISNYKEIRELRKLIIDEIASSAINFTVEHLKLAESMVQTILMAGLNPVDVAKEKSQWQKKL